MKSILRTLMLSTTLCCFITSDCGAIANITSEKNNTNYNVNSSARQSKATKRTFRSLATPMLSTAAEQSHSTKKPRQKINKIKKSTVFSRRTKNILLNKNIDATRGLSREDILRELDHITFHNVKYMEKIPTPELPIIPIELPPSPVENDEVISISSGESIPLRDILLELGKMANVNMSIDPEVSGEVILNVKNKPISEILKIISSNGKILHSVEDGVIRIYKDEPIVKLYSVDFINIIRSTKNEINIDTKVLSRNESQDPVSGSSSRISSEYEGNVWSSVENGLSGLIDKNGKADNEYYTVNKQAGIITVHATRKTHVDIEEYVNRVRTMLSSQVLIEAKIVEVRLNDEFKAGINWEILDGSSIGNAISARFDDLLPDSTEKGLLTVTKRIGMRDITSAVSLLDQFGITRTISSPRLHAINNQQAVLTFARNHVYFTVDIEDQIGVSSTTGQTPNSHITIRSTPKSVPIGMILTLQPSINMETSEISMSIRPTLSRISGSVKDPGVDFTAQDRNLNISNYIPIVEVRELDSMLKVKSGHVMVMGGLIENNEINEDKGIPILSRLPIIGHLFKSTTKINTSTETVIFIKATIIPASGTLDDNDNRLYKTGSSYTKNKI